MPYLPLDLRVTRWPGGAFFPKGPIRYFDPTRRNPPIQWSSEDPIYGAKIILALERDGKRTGTMDDVIAAVTKMRRAQGRDPGATFLTQKGVWETRGTKEIVVEDGVQIGIIAIVPVDYATFTEEMVRLSEILAKEFDQETVVCEIQRDGYRARLMFIGA